jgi:hypothetical protein
LVGIFKVLNFILISYFIPEGGGTRESDFFQGFFSKSRAVLSLDTRFLDSQTFSLLFSLLRELEEDVLSELR